MENSADLEAPNRIRQIRKERGLSQQRLAEVVGVSKMAISALERGSMQLTLEYMRRLARAFDLSAADLLSIEDCPYRPNSRERALLDTYRRASADDQRRINRVVWALAVPDKPPALTVEDKEK